MQKIDKKLKKDYNCKGCNKPMLNSPWDSKRWFCRDCEMVEYPDENE